MGGLYIVGGCMGLGDGEDRVLLMGVLPSLRFPWNSMDSTAISMEYSDSISMEAMANYAMASIECHGTGGILQNSMEVMELDLIEN